jgi:hypothetical protein
MLYLECLSGISGDMTVAALLDLGADEGTLLRALSSLPLDGYEVEISRVKKSGLDACDFNVRLDTDNHDHDMGYLHGETQEHHAEHEKEHAHPHRTLNEITRIIQAGDLTSGARVLALHIFDILADAEARAHGVSRDEVHFHEVGAVDSIVDIVAAAVCLDDLAPDKVIISSLSEGQGTVRCQHGVIPIPVPAVANIVVSYGLPVHHTGVMGELVTPTGAAIAAAVMHEDNVLPEDYRILRLGIGAGKRDYATTGILRAMWIEPLEQHEDIAHASMDSILKLEATIDDATGEQLGYCMDCLMEAGARDVSFVPVYMKKNRPAYEIHVICDLEHAERMEEILFRETTTIGVRRCEMARRVMEREIQSVETIYGTADVKVCTCGNIKKVYPEYDSVVEICKKTGLDFDEIRQLILDLYE